jgi:hypothetical protein
MKFTRSDRSLLAWMLYCCVLFNVFACSIGHGQMVGMQLNGIGGQFCTVDPATQAPLSSNPSEEPLPTLSKAFGCPLCSVGGGMGPAFNSSLTSRCCLSNTACRWRPSSALTSLPASPGLRPTLAPRRSPECLCLFDLSAHCANARRSPALTPRQAFRIQR